MLRPKLFPLAFLSYMVFKSTAQQYDPNRPHDQQYNQTQFGINQSQYGPYNHNNNNTHYGSQGPPYNFNQSGTNRDQYGNVIRDPNNRDPNNPYNRDPNNPYDRDPNNPYNRDPNNSYNRDPNNPYNRDPNSSFNRDPNNPYNRDPNNRDPNNPYNRDPYNRDPNNPYNRDPNNPYNRDPNNSYNNRDPNNPYNRDPHNRDPYHRDQYGNNSYYNTSNPYSRDPNNFNRDPNNRDPNNRDQYNRDRDQYNRDPNSPGYNRGGDQYNRDRDQYGRDPNNRDQYNRDRDQYNRDRQNGGGGGQQYGSDTNYQFGDRYGDDKNGGEVYNTNDNCCHEYCYTQDEQPAMDFATKTPYQVVYGKQSQQHKIPDCEPVQFWSINRHGTRFPSARTISRLRNLNRIHDEIIRNYEERRSYPDKGKMCPTDFDLLRRWRWNQTITEQNANALSSQGITDMKFLARRFTSKFEQLFREPYNQLYYNFQYTDSDRTHDSYQAYIEGLFRNNAYQVHANVRQENRLMRPTKECNTYQREVEHNPDTYREYRKFTSSQEYQQMVRDVFRKLGFRYTLNASVVDDMYDLCRYEKAWDLDRHSPWCTVFNKEQLKLLEYAEDLKYYYTTGYGNEINKRVGCPSVKDLYEKFESTVNGNSGGNKVSVYFTHSATLQTFLTAMGMNKDYQPLTADNYHQQARRKWRTSVMDPFASNLAAVLYQCRNGERNRVMFFLNEVPVDYPDCSVGLCNWSTVKQKLQHVAESCNLDFCDQNGGNTVGISTYAISVATALLVVALMALP